MDFDQLTRRLGIQLWHTILNSTTQPQAHLQNLQITWVSVTQQPNLQIGWIHSQIFSSLQVCCHLQTSYANLKPAMLQLLYCESQSLHMQRTHSRMFLNRGELSLGAYTPQLTQLHQSFPNSWKKLNDIRAHSKFSIKNGQNTPQTLKRYSNKKQNQ